ncbi:MAG TPA: T9SS type A sorting domain-containing protein [Saprospiraceae bacterium]|nr:T9SS type A sorting domain-containing protein [Saprospiraceae bacterium]
MKAFYACLLLFGLSIQFSFGQNFQPLLFKTATTTTADASKYIAPDAQPCSSPSALVCGQTLFNQTTSGFANNFSTASYNSASCIAGLGVPGTAYNAPDRLYKFTLASAAEINISLHILTPGADLDMYLLSTCQPATCIEASYSESPFEFIRVNLAAGDYYLVVDGFNGWQGSFNLRLSCTCNCVESADVGNLYACESFEQYANNDSIAAVSNVWDKWSNTVADAVVKSDGSNKSLKVAKVGNYEADVWLNFDTLKHGRYRLSFRIRVDSAKIGNYYVLHRAPAADGSNSNTAYRVRFNANNTGELFIGTSTIPNATFNYANGFWTEAMQIIDIDANVAELWIDDQFVRSWQFSIGDPSSLNQLQAVNFDAHFVNFSYAVDDICLRARPEPCFVTTIYDPVCVKNGTQPSNNNVARCQLYTTDEIEPCNTVCDFGGTSIYRGDNFNGAFTPSDRAPASLYTQQCVINAYGGDIPPNLCADIYVFSRSDDDDIGINVNNNNFQNVRAFQFACKVNNFNASNPDAPDGAACIDGEFCVEELPTSSGSYFVNINDCHNFYYIVVTGTVGETYSDLNIIPNGDCPSNPDPITCGSTLTGTITPTFSDIFTAAGTAYQQCYNGSRQYTGGEVFYKFTLAQPGKVNIKLTATGASPGAMGVFLYSFLCGETCLGYAENTASDPSATLTATLNDGIYYLVIDKNLDNAGNSTFSLNLECEQYSPFIDQNTFLIGDFSDCPTDPGVQHQVGIAYSPSYTPSDYFNFYFRNTDGKLKGNTEASQYWHNSTQPMYFDLNADIANDGEKCSYAIGDTFYVFIHQTEDGKRTFKRFDPTYAPVSGGGVTDSLIFKEDGFSLITKLEEIDAVNFGTETAFMRVGPDAISVPLVFTTNLTWAVEKVNGPATWLTINPTQKKGSEILSLTFSQNNSVFPNSVVLRFYSTEFPDLYRQFVTIEQQGQCIIPQAVNIVPSATAVCAGAPVTLTADVGAQYQNLYNYKWSTGDTSRIITKTPPVGANNFSVTVTNKYCFITSTDVQGVIVNPLPAAPQNPVGASICQGQNNIPPLSVSSPGGGLQIFWYANASGGTPLLMNPSLSYTPPAPVNNTTTYYAETKDPQTLCVSPTRTPVTLTVHTNPVITAVNTACAPNLLTYSITATVTNGTTVTTNPPFGGTFSNGVYTVSGITKGTNVTLNAYNPNCSVSQQVISPACLCPVITPPESGGNKTYCPGENPPPLTVDVGAGETADWFNQMTGGDSLGTGFSFTPATPGTYWVRARNLINNCTSNVRTPVVLTLNALPTFHILSQTCSADLTKYDLVFNSDASDASALPYLVNNLGNGVFEIKDITEGTGINIHLENDGTNCERDTLTAPHLCECPDLPKPFDPVNVSVCAGATNIPPLMVSTGPDLLANWYRNGQLQSGIPTLSFATTTEGTYYAKTFNPVNGCESDDSTAVTLEIKQLPTLSEGPKQCAPDWQTYQVTVSSSTPALTSAPSIIPSSNGNGTYTFYGVPIGVTLAVTATANGCSSAISIQPPVCSCPYIPNAPGNPNNPVICLGDAIPFLTVSVSIPSSETVDWYDAAVGGVKVGNNTLQYKPAFAFTTDTFYAQTKLIQSPSCVSARTPVILTVNQPVTTVSAGQNTSICADETLMLNGEIENAASAIWTASPLGGVFTPNSTFISAQKYAPPAGVDSVILKLTAYPVEPSVCPPKQHSMVLTVHPVPAVAIIQPGTCDPDLNSYSFIFDTDGDQVLFVPDIGIFSTNPDGTYTYGNIPEGQAVSIKATYVLTGCDNTLLPPAKDCNCPTDIPKPDSKGDKEVCEGDTQYPALVVEVLPGMTADWYDAPFNGTKLDSNKVAFLPPAPGLYYAVTRDPISGCTSLLRQVVVLSVATNPNADAGDDLTLCPGTTGTLSALQVNDYKYDWSNGQAGPVITVPAQNATYVLTVTLGNCTASDTVAVSTFPAVVAEIIRVSDVLCHGGNTGILTAISTSGIAPFEFAWSNGAIQQVIPNLPAGEYAVTVTDANECIGTAAYTIGEPPAMALSDTTIMNATDNQNNGSILAEITGGTPPYQYQWLLSNDNPFPGQTDSLLNGVFAGNYKIKVTDSNGCVFVSEVFTIENIVPVNEPGLNAQISVFPNPTTGKLYLRFNLPSRLETEVRVFDVLGRQLFAARPGTVQSDVLEFDLSDLAAGLYLLKIDLEGSFVNKTISLKK